MRKFGNMASWAWSVCVGVLIWAGMSNSNATYAEEPLHRRVDALILAAAGEHKPAPLTDDAEFLRRIYLDLTGRIPTFEEANEFLQSSEADKRAKLVDQLLAGPEYPQRMHDLFHLWLMERLGENEQWSNYLRKSFEENKPWDQMVREMLLPDAPSEDLRGAAFFVVKRLENYGQNPVDHPSLTADVGRLLLGKDFKCAQCHNHLFIDDYKQADFQGLFAFFQDTYIRRDVQYPAVGEKMLTKKYEFKSVFETDSFETGPRVPGLEEVAIPTFAKGEEFLIPPDKKTKFPGKYKFSPLENLAQQLPTAENEAFCRNIANRLWFIMLGRGIVHPLELHHTGNPPSHPELLDLLAQELAAQKFNIRWLLREIALSETYQRSSAYPTASLPPEDRFLAGLEKRISAEQLCLSMLTATGERPRYVEPLKSEDKAKAKAAQTAWVDLQKKFIKAFANPPREPEVEYAPSLEAVLFVLNEDTILSWLAPRDDNLAARLASQADSSALIEQLYLSVLTRRPTTDETQQLSAYLKKHADQREKAIKHMMWALLASTEFNLNH